MAMAKYDHSLVYDQAMGRGLPGQAVQVMHPDTGIPVDEVLDLNGTPIQALVSNSQGYVQPFQIEDGPPLVRVRVGRISYDLLDLAMIGEASLAAQQAAQAAVDAANLVGAPADAAIATAINAAASSTRTALDGKYASKATATSAAAGLMAAADKAKLDAATVFKTGNTIPLRNAAGNIEVGDATNANQAASRGFVETLAATQDLAGGIDLNTLQADRFYRQGSTANATLADNYPIARAGLLTVRNLANMTFQEYQVYGDSPDAGRKFWRGRYNSIWSPWQEVATASALTSVQSAVTAASAQISALQTTVPSLEELVATGHIAVAVNGTTPVTEFDWSANFTTFIAPFPLRVLSVDLMFDRWTLAANNTNYATIILRRARAGSFANIATKTTQATGGQPVAPRTSWGFAGSTWDTGARDMQAGDAVNLAFSFTGTGVKAVLPMSATIRYMPL